jgi:hypothetical protein
MALITSAATGNFSAGATWTGGVVPGVGDEARASTGHTITIDVDTTCDEVSNAGTGIFTLANGVTLTANVTHKSTTTSRNCLQFTAASPAVGTIVGNCTGGTVSSAVAVLHSSTGVLNIIGNANGGSGATSYGATITNNSTLATLNITGNSNAGSGNTAEGVRNSSTLASVFLTGNATGGSGANSRGIANVSSGNVTMTGIAAAGSGSGAVGALNILLGAIIVGRAKANAYGPGNTSGLNPNVGLLNSGLGAAQIQELEYGEYGMSPTSGTGIRLKKLSSNQAVFNYVDAGAAKTLVDATQGEMPAVTDVRTGVSYASGTLTGTCAVPAAASVGFGVPVDDTTGTAVVSVSDVANAVWTAASRTITEGGITAADVWSHATRTITGGTVDTLTNAPTVPSAEDIASEVRTELATELGRIDAAVSTRATPADIPASDITAIKGKTDLLNSDRLANVATTNIVGTLLAQAHS